MNPVMQTCENCGFENPRAFKACAACGAMLGLGTRASGRMLIGGQPVESTIVSAAPAAPRPASTSASDELPEGDLTPDDLELEPSGERAGHGAASEDHEPPIVGQEEVSAAIRAGIDRAFVEHKPTLVAIEGEEGSGRSRLLFHAAELAARLFPSVRILHALCRADDGSNAPFARMLLERFGVTPASSPAAVRGLVAAMVGEAIQSSDAIQIGETAHLLGHFAGIPFPDSPFLMGLEDRPEELRARELAALRRLFTGDAAQRPTLVLLDNMHLADDEAWTILEALLGVDAGIAFVVAGSAIAERASTLQAPGGTAIGPIAPLGEAEVASMLQILLPTLTEAPEPVVAALTHRSKGNPGALRELVFALVEAGLFTRSDEGIVPNLAKLEDGSLPVTMEDAIRARLERLDELERRTLDRAAIVGSVVWDRAVLAMMRTERNAPDATDDLAQLWPDDEDEEALGGALERLVEKGFLEGFDDPDVPFARAYRFIHGPSRDFVYKEIDPALRRRRHQTVAEWVTNAVERSLESLAILAAPHLEKAGHLSRAGRAHLEAARHEHAKMHTQGALRSVERALELLDDEELSRRVEALHIHGSLLSTLGRYDEAIAAFSEMLRISWRVGARGKGGAALNRIARVYTNRGDLEAARGPLVRALQLFRAASDLRGVASSLDDLAQLDHLRGDLDGALDAATEALTIRRQAQDARGEAVSLSTLGLIQHSRGNLDAAEEAFRAALQLRESVGDRAGTMQSLNHMGIILFERGDRDASEAAWRACLQEAVQMADRRMQAFVLNNLGESLFRADKPEEARALLLEAQGVARELADKRVLAEVERNLGLIALAVDDDHTTEILERALQLATEYGGKEAIARAHHAVGRGYARTVFDAAGGVDRRAEDALLAAIDLYRELGNELEAARVMADLGRHLVERGDVEGAKERLREARAIIRRLGGEDLERIEETLASLG